MMVTARGAYTPTRVPQNVFNATSYFQSTSAGTDATAAGSTGSARDTRYIRRDPHGATIPEGDEVVWKDLVEGHSL